MTAAPTRCRVTVAYDGAGYAGWQVQPGRPTVQGALEEALAAVLDAPVRVTGSGRTDAGVHALGQVAHFDLPAGPLPPWLLAAARARLPEAIRLRDLRAVDAGFHARRDAREKTYFYQLHLSREPGGERAVQASMGPFLRRTFHAVRASLDLSAMRAVARELVGRHDFTALSRSMDPPRPTWKTLRAVRVLSIPRGLRLFFTGDGFLYGMVRMMAGCLVQAGRGRLTPGELRGLLAARRRGSAPAALPAHGLFLWQVRYDVPCVNEERPLS